MKFYLYVLCIYETFIDFKHSKLLRQKFSVINQQIVVTSALNVNDDS